MEQIPDEIYISPRYELDTQLQAFDIVLQQEAAAPTANDQRVGCCMRALSNLLHQDEEVQEVLGYVFTRRKNLQPHYAKNLAMRAINKQLLYDESITDFPRAFDTTERYEQEISRILRDRHYGKPDFILDMLIRDVQSNIAARAAAPKQAWLLRCAAQGTVPREPTLVEFGCSQNQIARKLATNHPFAPIEAGWLADEDASQPEFVTDSVLTTHTNEILQVPMGVVTATGVDIWPISDPEVSRWAKSCTFRPAELLNDDLVGQYDALEQAAVDNVGFVNADITNPSLLEHPGMPPAGSVDIALFSMVLHQLPETGQLAALHHAYAVTAPDGIVVINEFARTDPGQAAGYAITERWTPWTCRTLVFDKTQPEAGFQEYFRWDHGRHRQVQLSDIALRSLGISHP